MKKLAVTTGVVALIWAGAATFVAGRQAKQGAPAAPSIASSMGTALHLEEVDGRFAEAIAAYRKVLGAPGATRAEKARAQFRIGACYERLGHGEARK